MVFSRIVAQQRSVMQNSACRFFASEAAPAAIPAKAKGGAGFFQRLSSFIVGAGVSALASQYYIYNELVEGNKVILAKQKELEKKLKALEGKK